MPNNVVNKAKSWRVRDRVGERFGRLTVVEYVGVGSGRQAVWKCVCDCGEVREVLIRSLASGATTSCGCYARERSIKHGRYSCSKGSTAKTEFSCWRAIVCRCTDEKHEAYHRYGGAGITLCDRWLDFDKFLEDMGPRPSPQHTVDRIKNDKGYEPGNCRWATREVQAANKKNAVRIKFKGETLSAKEWSKRTGIKADTILNRIKTGWTVGRALTCPVRNHSRKKGDSQPEKRLDREGDG